MIKNYKKHLIPLNTNIKYALNILNDLGLDAILFVVNDDLKLIGSLTDGDVRRGLLRDLTLSDPVDKFIQDNPKYIYQHKYNLKTIIEMRNDYYKIIPVVDKYLRIKAILNFRIDKSYLPIDVVIMAGGKGSRLKPLTDKTPKPLLKVGDKTILDHNIDRFVAYGVNNFWITLCYHSKKIIDHLGKVKDRGINFNFIKEKSPLGTIGALASIDNFNNDYILLTNSDLLTNMNYEEFFLDFISRDADMSVVSIPYEVNIPYAVINSKKNKVVSFLEKPKYTYYSNAGIYLIKKSILNRIPKNKFFNSTDLMDVLIKEGKDLISYPISDYWLDIGKPNDFEKAQNDIKYINFS
tara:strand:+ start:9465 stop:10517 length:1053 start_codon:yes stop_codon:yes gene_type:complete